MTRDLLTKSADACILTPVKNMAIRNSVKYFVPTTGMHWAY